MSKLLRSALAFVIGLVCTSKVIAQDAEALGADIVEQLHNSDVAGTMKNAMSGDPQAIMDLVTDYGPNAVLVILAMIISYMVASFLGRVVGGLVAAKVDVTLGRFLSKAIRNGIMLVILLGVLSTFGIDVTSFAAVIAALGFAVGMALQGTLSNFAAGVMLLVFRPFKVDDYIVVAGTEGIVEEIDLFTTRLNTLDNRHMIIPNGEIFGNLMENYSRNEYRRVDVNVGTEYSADLAETRQALERAVFDIEGAVNNPAPQVYLNELGSSSVVWQVRVWCRPVEYWDVRERLTGAAKESLGAAKIGIPFPQMDVHVVGQILAKPAAKGPRLRVVA